MPDDKICPFVNGEKCYQGKCQFWTKYGTCVFEAILDQLVLVREIFSAYREILMSIVICDHSKFEEDRRRAYDYFLQSMKKNQKQIRRIRELEEENANLKAEPHGADEKHREDFRDYLAKRYPGGNPLGKPVDQDVFPAIKG